MTSAAYLADEVWTLARNQSDVFTLDFTDWLDSGDTLSGVNGTASSNGQTYTLGVTAATGIVLGTPAINGSTITVISNGATNSIAASKAVQVAISAPSATVGRVYEVTVVASTTNGRVASGVARLEIIG